MGMDCLPRKNPAWGGAGAESAKIPSLNRRRVGGGSEVRETPTEAVAGLCCGGYMGRGRAGTRPAPTGGEARGLAGSRLQERALSIYFPFACILLLGMVGYWVGKGLSLAEVMTAVCPRRMLATLLGAVPRR